MAKRKQPYGDVVTILDTAEVKQIMAEHLNAKTGDKCYRLVIGKDGRSYIDTSREVPMDTPILDLREEG